MWWAEVIHDPRFPAKLRAVLAAGLFVGAAAVSLVALAVARARKIQRFLSQPFHVAEVFTGSPGKYVPLKETIRGFKMETIKSDEGDEDKVVCYFVEDVKPMVVNRTNSQLIGSATGARTAGESVGKQIVVYNDPSVGFGGKVTGGLRVKRIAGAPRPAPAAPRANTQRGPDDFGDDSVPF
jgi:hypothetical protein